MSRNRADERKDFDHPTRLRLVEGDVDTLENGQHELVEELKRIRQVLVGVLVSITTAALLLAVNVMMLGGPT